MEKSKQIISKKQSKSETFQFSTFYISNQLYGIEVTRVQEVVRPLPMTTIPLGQKYVNGLINLRGQVATAIGVRDLFEMPDPNRGSQMNVVCKCENHLISLLVDDIGDVVEVSKSQFEGSPQTVSPNIRRFMAGVYQLHNNILNILDIDKISKFLAK